MVTEVGHTIVLMEGDGDRSRSHNSSDRWTEVGHTTVLTEGELGHTTVLMEGDRQNQVIPTTTKRFKNEKRCCTTCRSERSGCQQTRCCRQWHLSPILVPCSSEFWNRKQPTIVPMHGGGVCGVGVCRAGGWGGTLPKLVTGLFWLTAVCEAKALNAESWWASYNQIT